MTSLQKVRVHAVLGALVLAVAGALGLAPRMAHATLPVDGIMSAGDRFNCYITQDATIRCAGTCTQGELGNGSNASSLTTVAVVGLGGTPASITSGSNHACSRLADGTVNCWGRNAEGQLGNATNNNASSPVVVSGITDAAAIASGHYFSCVVRVGGAIKCWGANNAGQIGTGSTGGSFNTPQGVLTISNATSVDNGTYHACARMADGGVRCWGANQDGQLGDGSTTGSASPVTVSGISTATAVSAGGHNSCALLADASVWCWGLNDEGQLGNGTTGGSSSTPTMVSGITSATQIGVAEGARHACALLADTTVRCWGRGDEGQLGNGANSDSNVPVAVLGLSGVEAISVGGFHVCALKLDDSIVCWGSNGDGQFGDGTTNSTNAPTFVDSDADGFADQDQDQHIGPANTATARDNCPALANPTQLNTDGNFTDNTPPASQDDRTHPNSDAAGDACDADDDNDGLTDADEASGAACGGTITDPLDADTDNDRVIDGPECALNADPTSSASKPSQAACGANVDADGDRLKAWTEYCGYYTSDANTDTDGDRTLDGAKDGCEAASLNGDRVVNAGDQLLMVLEILREASPSLRLASYDVNKDGVVNAGDQLLLALFIAPSGQCP